MRHKQRPMWTIGRIARMIRASQEQKFDWITVVTGRRGLGKSTFAVKLAYRMGKFNPKTDLVFSREDVIKQLQIKRRGIIVADEMINVTFNRDFWSEDQKTLIKMLNMYRDRENVLICCVPNFSTLDKQFLGLVKMRVDIARKGFGVIHKPHETIYSADQWDIKLNESIERKWIARKVYKPKYERLSTYKGLMKFNDLTPSQRELYEQLKVDKRNELLMKGQEEERDDKTKTLHDNIYAYVKKGEATKDLLQKACLIAGLKYNLIVSNLNNRLKNEGLPSLKSFLSKDSAKIILKQDEEIDGKSPSRPKLI